MAQHGAHVTQTLQPKPSIFEVVAADSLQTTFHPALKRIVNYLACLKPTKFGWMLRYYDELYLCLHGLLQQHYLRTYGKTYEKSNTNVPLIQYKIYVQFTLSGGTLSEIFYGLTRTRTATNCLSRTDKTVAFVCLVILPYVATKLEAFRQNTKDTLQNTTVWQQKTLEMRTKKLAVQCITSSKVVYDILQLFQFVAYMADKSKAHSLANRVMGQQLNYLPPDATVTWTWSDLFGGQFRGATIFSGIVFRTLEMSAFFLQFLQWWQNEASFSTFINLPTPEPPATDALSQNRYRGICPICMQHWHIPTANRISGFIFCYKCIVRELDETKACPVTSYASTIDDLVRIYDI